MNFNEVLRIAQAAWDKTKPPSDPVWNGCAAQHRQMFAAKAEAVINTGHAVDNFEAAVKRLAQEAEGKQAVIEEVAAESPGSHSDEIQLEAARRQGRIPSPEAPKAAAASAGVASAGASQSVAAEAPKKRSHKAKSKGEAKSSKKSSKKG